LCGLCNRLNAFILTRDAQEDFGFASLQSPTGQSLLRRFGLATSGLTTFYVVTDYSADSPELLAKSRAALFVLSRLGGVWPALGVFGVLPTAILDAAYDLIARYRYRLFGRYEACPMPAPEHKQRFIDV
jgi:predicted DCC family thiol-disulfide oxidoreductase YuxK